jgi:hypothetical protein
VSVYSPAGNGFVIRELAAWNTTTTAWVYKWARLTTAGTPGAGLTEMEWREDGVNPTATAFDAHSADCTVGLTIDYLPIGAAIGAGYYYTYYAGPGIVVASGTGNGVGLVLASGTGQILSYKIVWEEI